MDIKRTVLWVVFTMSLLILWDNWNRSSGKQSIFFPTPTTQNQAANSATNPATKSASSASATSTAAAGATAPATNAAPAVPHELVTITTDIFKADIDSVGGELKRLELLQYKETAHREHWYDAFLELAGRKEAPKATKNIVLFEETAQRTYLAQTGLIGNLPNHNSAFTVKPGPRSLEGANQLDLVLESEVNGVKLTKTYTFKKGEYIIGLKHTITNNTAAAITPSLYLQLIHDGTKPEGGGMMSGNTEFYAPAVYTSTEYFQKLDFEKIEKGSSSHAKEADNGWVAMLQHFFVSSIIPEDKVKREIFSKKVDTNLYAVGNVLKLNAVAPGASISSEARLYSGPQESAKLEKIATGLDLVKDYWYFAMIAKPMFSLMEFIHRLLGNWGWTIIVFTIAIKLALFPLSAAGFRSMAKTKLLTPKMTAIRERHKNDPQKMNQAMMELYKTEKINPLGGCLPVLIQMPVFLSLYWVLQASVEMRGAPWMAWITDLTAPDPYIVLPVIYAISMFITTKLNPQPADPMQAKMMMFMPLAFSVMFLFFPSGLVLYWVVNNLLSIAQQWVINNKLIPPEHKA